MSGYVGYSGYANYAGFADYADYATSAGLNIKLLLDLAELECFAFLFLIQFWSTKVHHVGSPNFLFVKLSTKSSNIMFFQKIKIYIPSYPEKDGRRAQHRFF